MPEYKIYLGPDEDIDHYQIQFINDASKAAILNGSTNVDDTYPEYTFLDE